MGSGQGPQLIGTHFLIGEKIAAGSFGELRLGKNLVTQEEVAIKLEKKDCPAPTLPLEFRFYKVLNEGSKDPVGIPKIFYFGLCGEFNGLVMELLGKSLENMFDACSRIFSLKTTIQVALQMLDRLEFIHSKKLIYRDMKPENFLFGRKGTKTENVLHILDFGLTKDYIGDNGLHIPLTKAKNFIGTARYMSIATHSGKVQSRRDDLESMGYMLAYFLKGSLPWQGQTGPGSQRNLKIGSIKKATAPEVLFQGQPVAFATFLAKTRGMEFEEKPDYLYFRQLFTDLFNKNKLPQDGLYDWSL